MEPLLLSNEPFRLSRESQQQPRLSGSRKLLEISDCRFSIGEKYSSYSIYGYAYRWRTLGNNGSRELLPARLLARCNNGNNRRVDGDSSTTGHQVILDLLDEQPFLFPIYLLPSVGKIFLAVARFTSRIYRISNYSLENFLQRKTIKAMTISSRHRDMHVCLCNRVRFSAFSAALRRTREPVSLRQQCRKMVN